MTFEVSTYHILGTLAPIIGVGVRFYIGTARRMAVIESRLLSVIENVEELHQMAAKQSHEERTRTENILSRLAAIQAELKYKADK